MWEPSRLLRACLLCIMVGAPAAVAGSGDKLCARDAYPRRALGTVVTSDQEALGAVVLARSLQRFDSPFGFRMLCILPVLENVSEVAKRAMLRAGYTFIEGSIANPQGEGRFGHSYSKLLFYNQTDFEYIMHIDADAYARKPIDDALTSFPYLVLTDRLSFNAAQDWYQNYINRDREKFTKKVPQTGVMIVKPDTKIFGQLLEKVETTTSYDKGDQGFMEAIFGDAYTALISMGLTDLGTPMNTLSIWPQSCNPRVTGEITNPSLCKLWRRSGYQAARIVHFIGRDFKDAMIGKPWDWFLLGDLQAVFEELAESGQVSEGSQARKREHIPNQIKYGSGDKEINTILSPETVMLMDEWLDVLLAPEPLMGGNV